MATVGACIVFAYSHSVSIRSKNSAGMLGMFRPKKSLIWLMKITTAIPLVKPITTLIGINRISTPILVSPMTKSRMPAIMVATIRF